MQQLEELVSRASPSADPFPGALSCQARSPLVDRALGMMGFTAPALYPRTTAFSIEALVSILSSAAFHGDSRPGCVGQGIPEMDRCQGKNLDDNLAVSQERVEYGSCISMSCLEKLAETCKGFVKNGQGDQALPLIEAVLKVATDIPRCKLKTPSSCMLYVKNPGSSSDAATGRIIELLDILREENLYSKLAPSSRLQAWRLDPKQLKQDLSDFVHAAVEQPDLDLAEELFQRQDWKALVLGLADSPLKFLEADRLLEKWSSVSNLRRVREALENFREAKAQTNSWKMPVDIRPSSSS